MKYILYFVILAILSSTCCIGVMFIADDLDLSPDFFEYFIATLPILEADPTLWCVSAWNDNGKVDHISNEPGISFDVYYNHVVVFYL